MELKAVCFNSFRSLADATLNITHRCMSLVGLNESGKTNVLLGIRTLDNDYKLVPRDQCEVIDQYPTITFEFKFSQSEADKVFKSVIAPLKQISTVDVEAVFAPSKFEGVNFVRYLSSTSKEPTRIFKTVAAIKPKDSGIMILKKEFRASTDTFKIGEKEYQLSKAQIAKKDQIPEEVLPKFEELTEVGFTALIAKSFADAVEGILPQIVYWTWDKKYLIPPEISYEKFMENNDPRDVCVPLYNIFLLSGTLGIYDEESLAEKIKEWKTDSGKRKKDAQAINATLNKHIRDVWKEFDQEFDLTLDADRITLHITDPKSPTGGYYEMERRSQGFWSFISFLLTISAETRCESLNNYILVLDEPETHLHPSGVRFMRDELLKLADQGNYVVFATHSIFMIDRKDLRRHVMVKKKHEKTQLTPATENNIIQESVLYLEGFGTDREDFSIGPRTLVFEGELDRKIFEFYNSECLMADKKKFKDYQTLVGGGTNDIEKFIKSRLLSSETSSVLVLDRDEPGRNIQRMLLDKYGDEYKKNYILHYYGSENDHELEDLLPIALVQSSFEIAAKASRKDVDTPTLKPDQIFGSQFKAFRSRNKLTQQENDLFEETFKKELERLVTIEIDEIQKKKTKAEKKAEFEIKFPKLCTFIETLDG